MKKAGILAISLAVLLAAVVGLARAGVEGSKHDFSHEDWSEGDLCGVCHTPHRALAPKAAPLWEPQADLSRRFGTNERASDGVGSGSARCLLCHDGTIAGEAVGGVRKEAFVNKQNPGLFEAGAAAKDHPIGVSYPDYDDGFHSIASVLATGTVKLPGSKVECVSCHDQHNTSGQKAMLVADNARSALCLACHRK